VLKALDALDGVLDGQITVDPKAPETAIKLDDDSTYFSRENQQKLNKAFAAIRRSFKVFLGTFGLWIVLYVTFAINYADKLLPNIFAFSDDIKPFASLVQPLPMLSVYSII
jgi:hypothetical protein